MRKGFRYRKPFALGMTGSLFLLPGNCDLGTFSATQTVTLDAREAITQLLVNAIVGPVQSLITNGVNNLFDQIEGEEA
ncbi:MAG: hypothetical protein AB7N71_14550 [Phycisphaerae bacterium]